VTIELYHTSFSTCSQKVRLVLAEKQLSYQSRIVDMQAREHVSKEYLRINPNGVVPTLIHDGQVIGDSSVICEYLDEVFPNPALSLKTAHGRAQMRMWMRYLEEVPTAAVRVPSFNLHFRHAVRPDNREEFAQLTEKLPLRKHFYREMGSQGFADSKMQESIEKLRACFERVERALDQRAWLMGQFSLADVLLIPSAIRMLDLGLATLWNDLPNVGRWLERVQARPSFPVAYFAGSRLSVCSGGASHFRAPQT
jgi:glutathione S-transferase